MPRKEKMGGYLFPDPIDGYDLTCFCVQIPDEIHYRAAFRDALAQLTRGKNWRRGTVEQRIAVEQYLSGIILPQLEGDMTCCCDAINQMFYQNISIKAAAILTLQTEIFNRYDGTNPNSINPNAPNDDYDGDGSFDRLDALCEACDAFVRSMVSDYQNRIGLALGLAAGLPILTLVFPPIGMIAVGLAAGAGVLLSVTALEATQDETAIQDVICCMYTNLVPLALTQANFETALDSCGFDTGSHQAIVRDAVAGALTDEKAWAVFVDALGNAYSQITAGIDYPCSCNTFCHTFDFTVDDGGWVNSAFTYAYGEWTGGVGWEDTLNPDSTDTHMYREIAIDRTFTSRTITKITIHYTRTFGTQDAVSNDVIAKDNYDIGNRIYNQDNTTSDNPIVWEGEEATGFINIQMICGLKQYSTQDPGGTVTITSIEICGRGDDPF